MLLGDSRRTAWQEGAGPCKAGVESGLYPEWGLGRSISLEISMCKFNSRGKNTAVPFPNWNSPPMCFWEAQMPWRFPSNNNRDCSQL